MSSIREIAALAGVSKSTAAEALKNSSRVAKGTRERVWRIARETGYQMDPWVARLMQQVRQGRKTGSLVKLAYVTPHSWWESEHLIGVNEAYFTGAKDRAEASGYSLERFSLEEYNVSGKRMAGILHARGYEGVIIGSFPSGDMEGQMDFLWDPFAVATVGFSLKFPVLNRASCNYLDAVRMVLKRLRRQGYQRIGMLLLWHWDERSDFLWSSAYSSQQLHLPFDDRIRPRLVNADEDPGQVLREMVQSEQIDALLGMGKRYSEIIHAAGFKPDREFDLFKMHIDPEDSPYPGCHQRLDRVGAAAVDLLIADLLMNRRGLPEHHNTVLTEPDWYPGRRTYI